MRVIVALCLILSVVLTLLAGCTLEPDLSRVDDGVEYITRKYGIPPERVLELAATLGVSPDEIPPPQAFDPVLPFPIPYFKEQFEAFEKNQGRKLTRPEVDQIVRGYLARCQVISAYTEYLFYSTEVNRTWLWRKREAAVIMRVEYTVAPGKIYAPDEAIYAEVDIRDIPLELTNPWGNFGYIGCVRDAKEQELSTSATPEPS